MFVSKPNLNVLWVDIETNGLVNDVKKCHILEIAAIYTDSNLVQIGKPFQSLVLPTHIFDSKNAIDIIKEPMNKFVRDMHTGNGLITDLEILYETTKSLDKEKYPSAKNVEGNILNWLNDLIPQDVSGEAFPEIRMGGHSTNSLDLPYIRYHMPELFGLLSHRTVDISNIVRFYTDICGVPNDKIPFGLKVAGHRAMDDCVMAVEEGRKAKEWIQNSFRAIDSYGPYVS